MKLRYFFLRICIVCLLATLTNTVSAQGQLAQRVLLVDVDTHTFPEIVCRLGIYDAQGQQIDDLQSQEVDLEIDGQPITATLQTERRSPAIVIVADTSFAMNDQATPSQNRAAAMVGQIKRMLDFVPSDAPVRLITFDSQATPRGEWGASSVLTSTLEGLLTQPLPVATAETPYALTSGIMLGIKEFGQLGPLDQARPRAMFVYAAGAPQVTIDTAAIQNRLTNLMPNPPLITFVGLGSAAPGEYTSQPGNPESLQQAESALADTVFRPFFTMNTNEIDRLQVALDARSQQVANLEQLTKLTIPAPKLSSGAHQIKVTVHNLVAEQRFRVPVVPPQIALHTPSQILRNGDLVNVEIRFAQHPVQEVTYYLDGQPIGTSTSGPNFAYTLDLARLNIGSEPDRTYTLAAVATDTSVQHSEQSSATIQIESLTPPATQSGQNTLLMALVIALSLVALLVVVAVVLLLGTSSGRNIARSLLARGGQSNDQNSLEPSSFDSVTIIGDQSSNTETVLTAGVNTTSTTVTIVEGAKQQSYQLHKSSQILVGRGLGNVIALDDRQVSRRHAKLMLKSNGVELTDLGSDNGTFIGERKRKLAPNTAELLRAGDIFWIGQNVKLIVQQPKQKA